MEKQVIAYEAETHSAASHMANAKDVTSGYSKEQRRNMATSAMNYNLEVIRQKQEASRVHGHVPTSGQINPWH